MARYVFLSGNVLSKGFILVGDLLGLVSVRQVVCLLMFGCASIVW